jgi:hypothetical protein
MLKVRPQLDSVDQLQRAVSAGLDGLGGLAPAAVQDGVRGGDPGRRRRRTLSAVLVWLRATERISVSDLVIVGFDCFRPHIFARRRVGVFDREIIGPWH